MKHQSAIERDSIDRRGIANDEASTSPRAIRSRLERAADYAKMVGQYEESDRITQAIRSMTHLDRPKLRYDPVMRATQSPRLLHAAERLRAAYEATVTRKPVIVPEPSDPELTRDDKLPSIKNPPSIPDPKNRWGKAKRTTDAKGNPVECPTIWPPKKPKPPKASQHLREQKHAKAVKAIRARQDSHSGFGALWDAALGVFELQVTRDAVTAIIIDRKSLEKAAALCGLTNSGRNKKAMKDNLVAALEAAAQHLESGA